MFKPGTPNFLGRQHQKTGGSTRTVNGTTTTYVYDGAQAIAETKGGIDTTLLTGLQIDEVIGRYASSGNRIMMTDALGSVIAEAKDDRSITTRREYTPYGQASQSGETSANDSQYTAREATARGCTSIEPGTTTRS